MVKDEISTYLDRFVTEVAAPAYEGTSVIAMEKPGSVFQIESSAGRVTADSIIAATSLYSQPFVLRSAESLPNGITQINTADHRNPAQLPPDGVIVVGSGQSGCQIVEDLHLAGSKVHTHEQPFRRSNDVRPAAMEIDICARLGRSQVAAQPGYCCRILARKTTYLARLGQGPKPTARTRS